VPAGSQRMEESEDESICLGNDSVVTENDSSIVTDNNESYVSDYVDNLVDDPNRSDEDYVTAMINDYTAGNLDSSRLTGE